ncbi:MAG: restriction endonuclease [Rariglobus sp.]|jgi:hypothetical protein|nr:restriction endonuclease [Rariglobus sp.]
MPKNKTSSQEGRRMTAGKLRDYFSLVASKRVMNSEVNPNASNSHEFNGTTVLKESLGRPPFGQAKRYAARYVYFDGKSETPVSSDSELSWYKSHRDPDRTEWRLYYKDNLVVGKEGLAQKGDLIVFLFSEQALKTPIVSKKDSSVNPEALVSVVVAAAGSPEESEIIRLLGVKNDTKTQIIHEPDLPSSDVDYVGRELVENLGIDLNITNQELVEELLKKQPNRLPSPSRISEFSKRLVENFRPIEDPDYTISEWWDQTDMLYRAVDRHLLKEQISTILASCIKDQKTVDFDSIENLRKCFMSFAQAGKSRAGSTFEYQIASVLEANKVMFSQRPKLSTGDIPDFIMPSVKSYNTQPIPKGLVLTMLAAKTTCKERWQQALAEAPRIPKKHLITLSGALPKNQFTRMRELNLTLVIPKNRHHSLPMAENLPVITFGDFIKMVISRQKCFS